MAKLGCSENIPESLKFLVKWQFFESKLVLTPYEEYELSGLTNKLPIPILLKMAERRKEKRAKQSIASKYHLFRYLDN